MFSGVVIAIVCLPALLTFVWFSELLAGCFALRKGKRSPDAVPNPPSHTTAVLIPAHNEGAGMLPTIRDIQAQLEPNDRILVVADNCTDDTAAIAQAAGVDVTVRAVSILRTSLLSLMPTAGSARTHCGICRIAQWQAGARCSRSI
jgi:cellulose synthase/poly-beta-1,6-N-acetylglucosamine synthase-like glycosyltransferase